MAEQGPDLTERQREILIRVVEEYVATGQPVGSKSLVERAGLRVSPATVAAKATVRCGEPMLSRLREE